ncbi:MAG TPA: hypothetical protein DCL61_04280 [Cyanobacteria bacterium UBA12227]|nr:hypothetical protein [Cyanobacteria bacterium UBA12227]HAX85375.1 hypothetical protein [Cyanobacteria bacterium UBA11370]
MNNQIYQKTMPQGKHSTLQIRLADTINQAEFPLFSWLKLGQHF